MGALRNPKTFLTITLPVRSVVGRGPSSALPLLDRRTSSEHATVFWASGRWRVRDLASRNGTWLNGRRVEPGVDHELVCGVVLWFGDRDNPWVLEDDTPPIASARGLTDGALVFAVADVLSLPSAAEPLATVLYQGRGRWILEDEHGEQAVHDHQELKIGDRVWRLHLPEPRDTTLTSEHDPGDPSEPSLRVHFLVSRDEESVSLTVVTPAGEHRWEPRAPHYLLLTLARQRLAETQLAEHERGWLDVDRLARMLNLNRKTVNVYICRLRAQLADAGVPGGATLIQRRLLSQQIRIGVGLLEILHG
ncbi:MAG: FHA domain-containing protein [Deltaproteobacteria bacterium]|nr:FHA domain-containing protein [Deltaproteobacteria bacterium]